MKKLVLVEITSHFEYEIDDNDTSDYFEFEEKAYSDLAEIMRNEDYSFLTVDIREESVDED